ncbi:BRO family protein [Cohaesibacter intestini]|uniref:BRO family protein n=1 Tax=Cohaesibacter intestini TaxID=2211145 RepID=UPI000DE8B5D3|nr:BRO family protein [Cohaesibacter intestini]
MLMKKHTTTTPEVSTFTFVTRSANDGQVNSLYDIRTVTFEDKPNDPWFVAADVCKALGFKNGPSAVRQHTESNQRNTIVIRDGIRENPQRLVVSEGGLYALILGSELPSAKEFKLWVTDKVLPAIRKDGMYVKGEEKVLTGEMSMEEMTLKVLEGLQAKVGRLTNEKAALTEDITRKQFVIEEMHDQVGELTEDNAALEAVKAEMEPMVEGFQHFLSVDGTYNKEAVAKILGFPSAIKLNRWLAYLGIQSARKTWKGGVERIKFWYLRAEWVKRQDLFKTKTSTDVIRGTQVHI